MKILKIYRCTIAFVFVVSIVMFGFMFRDYLNKSLPKTIYMQPNNKASFDVGIPVSVEIDDTNSSVSSRIQINSYDNGNYKFMYKLFGVIPIKEVSVTVTNKQMLYPVGLPVGLYLHTDGVMVINEGEIIGENSVVTVPAKGKIKKNDYIVKFNNIKVNSKSQLIYLIDENKSNPVKLTVFREGKYIETTIQPVRDKNGEYKLGIWVRDDMQGIGTLTYSSGEGEFGALGHGVSDIDTGKLLDSTNGKIYKANIWGIKRGENGNPGGLCGNIDYNENNILGEITKNTNQGLFGTVDLETINYYGIEPLEVGYKQEIKKGEACIQMIMDGKVEQYKIQIQKINMAEDASEKNMIIEVTDQRLLDKTNGIVQGMSGSPIIQNGRVIGAVTHVFVDNPRKGYGIFIEEMLKSELK